ncbi:MAG: TrmH family RNA methyltransferase [Acidimicrobiia bacterium]
MGYDITSPGNDRITRLVRLRQRRQRDAEGVFVVEGERLYRRALAAGMTPELTLVDDQALTDTTGPTLTVEPSLLDKVSYRQRSQGLVAIFPQIETGLHTLAVTSNPLLLIAENIEKPGNLGAMLRSAAAADVEGLVTVGGTVDPHNPNVVRSSTGALFTVPLALSDWDELGAWARARGIRVIGATPTAATLLWDIDLTGAVAVVIGSEDLGLSGRATQLADALTAIPQAQGGVDSLNASVAAAVILFEAVRQRHPSAR